MQTKASPLMRQELQKLLVTDADAFTALRFLRHRERTPALSELENQGGNEVPGFAGALCDLYHSLWTETPKVKEEIPADRRFFAEILRGALASSAFDGLHAQTQYSDIKSVLGTLSMGDAVLATMSPEEKKNLQDTASAQKTADEAEDEAKQAENEADSAEALAQMVEQSAGQGESSEGGQESSGDPSGEAEGGSGAPKSGSPSGSPSGGSHGAVSGMTPDEAQALANELARQAREARAKANSARETANSAKEVAESIANQLLGQPGSEEAMERAKDLARRGLAALKRPKRRLRKYPRPLTRGGLRKASSSRWAFRRPWGF
jgi:hypothetical protein